MPSKFRIAIGVALLLGLSGLAVRAQEKKVDPKSDASLERMRKDIFFLAGDDCEGRGLGTLGLDLAGQYIAVQFSRAGLKPGGVNGTYFQPFPFATNAQQDGESTLVIEGPNNKKITLKQGVDFQVVGSSAPGKRSAPLVFAGYGVTAKGIAYDDYSGIDVKGKVVVVLRRVPRFADNEKPFDGANKDALAALDGKQNRAELHQAAAVILVNDASELPMDGLVSFQVSKGLSTVSMPFVHIKRSVFDDILKASTGKNLIDTEKAIDGDLKPRSSNLKGWTAHLDVKIKRTEIPVRNVLGYIEGKGPLANETVVVGSHYDHLGYGGAKAKGKATYYGADDNGSGTTSVMELARRFAAKKDREGRRLVFMTFTAEEMGLIGSRHYTTVAPLFPLKDTVAMFNMDMVGRLVDLPNDAKPKLYIEGADTAKNFEALVNKANPGFDLVNKTTSVFFRSDQYNFYVHKIPVMFFWTSFHPDYHKPSDTPDKINLAGMKKVVDFAEVVIDDLRSSPKRPEYVQVQLPKGGGGGGVPKGKVTLGIQPDYDFGGKGILVKEVPKGGAADLGGIKSGDIIVEIAGKAIADFDNYRVAMAMQKNGTTIEVKILRDKKEMTLKLSLK